MAGRFGRLLTSTVLLALASCNFAPLGPERPLGGYARVPVVGVLISSRAIVLAPGEEVQAAALPIFGEYRDRWERPYPPVPVSWSSSDPSLVEVGPGGLLRARAPGRVTLAISARGHQDTATVVVRASPEPVEPPLSGISVGTTHACAVDAAGALSCWGSNSHGAVGVGHPSDAATFLAPVRIGGGTRFGAVAVGGDAIGCALARDGTPFCWGGETGRRQPAPVGGSLRFTDLTATSFTVCGRTEGGEVFCWGRGFGADPRRIVLPQPVNAIDGHCGIASDGAALCWSPGGEIETFGGPAPFVRLSSGWGATCALDATGRAFCWGQNESGELGTGPPTEQCRLPGMPAFGCQREPALVRTELTFSSLAVGNRFACGLADGGLAYCWGFNGSGQLGTGGFARADVPEAVVGGHRFSSLSARESRICGVSVEGVGYCWGNAYLGDGRTWTVPPDRFPTGTPRPMRVRNPV